jgi:hypothetical protein
MGCGNSCFKQAKMKVQPSHKSTFKNSKLEELCIETSVWGKQETMCKKLARN